MSDVLDRGGHLSELTLDRLRFDPPEVAFRAAVEAHLAACESCRGALAALVEVDATCALVPPTARASTGASAEVVPLTARRRRAPRFSGALAGVAALALAAIALFVLRPWAPPPDDDVITVRGGPFDFEVHVHDGERSRPASDGDVVYPGERMGFRVHLRQDGYLAIIGRDDRGMTYSCYPRPEAGAVASLAHAVAHTPTDGPVTLPVAMRFDDTLGDEHITAVFCAFPFELGPSVISMADELARAGCSVTTLTLHKRAPEAPR